MHWAALIPTSLPSSASPIDLQSLAVWALQFTPRVVMVEEGVLLEVEASMCLFSGTAALHSLVESGAQELGASVAWAPTGLAALALARQGVSDGFHEPMVRLLEERITAVAKYRPPLARVGCPTTSLVKS